MDRAPVRVSGSGLALAAGFVAGLTGLGLLTQTVQDSEIFGRWHNTLLLVNGAGALVLMALLAGNLYRLLRARRRRVPGAALRLRMLGAFAAIAAVPLLVVFLVAVQFLQRGIETWADDQIAASLERSLQLSRAALEEELRADLKRTQAAARTLSRTPSSRLYPVLSGLRQGAGAREMTIFGRNYRIIATSAEGTVSRMPELPSEDVLLQLPRDGRYVGLEPMGDEGLRVRVAVVLGPTPDQPGDTLILQAIYPVAEQLGALAESVQGTYKRFGELLFLSEPLELSFTLALFVAVLLTLLAALYGAFVFARRLVAPIRALIDGTRAVAAGRLDTRLPVAAQDDLGALIGSFNDMTAQLASASDQAALNAAEIERSRSSLATVLARLTSGVVAFDSAYRLRIANAAAASILHADLPAAAGQSLAEISARHAHLARFFSVCAERTRSAPEGWREQLTISTEGGGRRALMCSASPLPDEQGGGSGYVLVFDDITGVLQAQREAAWGEVARRLAHEIKNPLTPIQLSAERIRRRYLDTMDAEERDLLDRATHTIVQQVEAMRDMVNAFGEYARSPELNFAPLQLNQLVREVADLYHGPQEPQLTLDLDPALGIVEADALRLRQLLHNLIRNASEALEGQAGGQITVSTRQLQGGAPAAEIRISDNGPGIDAELLDRIFDPYVTSKSRGTGLGLAIVRRLVEEHGGEVIAENTAGGGACIRVTLPVSQRGREPLAEGRQRRAGERR